ncbi:MAG: 16S rRNA (guanine(527)-N(7))-methyltransferase RsmG [Candidatus Sumerlaeaceae bacterium]|nr:16S rRNA (guanine(527)-N(7))-methyltransferase RsmG [Candidatus Sumerlaeaceae bacterium]
MSKEEQSRAYLQREEWISELVADEELLAKLARFMSLLIEYNQRINLTAIREPEAMARLHFADSLAPLKLLPWVSSCQKGADIGSGAGFPVVPLAICVPGCRWFAIESIGKKATFLRLAIEKLDLPNVEVIAQRAEQFARSAHRNTCDMVTARAVGPFISLCELGLPLLRLGGRLVLFKTQASCGEATRAEKILPEIGGTLIDAVPYRLAGDRQDRVLFVVERTGDVPLRYPRDHAKPFKQPLA